MYYRASIGYFCGGCVGDSLFLDCKELCKKNLQSVYLKNYNEFLCGVAMLNVISMFLILSTTILALPLPFIGKILLEI